METDDMCGAAAALATRYTVSLRGTVERLDDEVRLQPPTPQLRFHKRVGFEQSILYILYK